MQETNLSSGPEPMASNYYVWGVAEKNISVLIDYGVVDRLLTETLRGFGAVPKRGAEVGGILLGTAAQQDGLVIKIEDFEPVPISYKNGPSYLLTPEDFEVFRNAVEKHRAAGGELIPVGYFRSHTRDGLGLSPEDVQAFNTLFPDSTDIAMLVKPSVAKPCQAAIFFREPDGMRTDSSYLEFPLKRKLGLSGASSRRLREEVPIPEDPPQSAPEELEKPEEPDFSLFTTEKRKPKANFWIPLSFIFLVIGVLLGFQAGMVSLRGRGPAVPIENPYSLDLSAKKDGDAINLKWNRLSPALKKARGAILTITDGLVTNTVKIEPADLQAGSLFYKRTSEDVKFRFEVFLGDHSSLVENLEIKPAAPQK